MARGRKPEYVVSNGHYAQHQGTEESCREYIRNAGMMFGVTGLRIIPLSEYNKGKR